MPTLEPCDLHEVTNCSICTGKDKAFEASLEDSTYSRDRGVLPLVPGGVSIWAQWPGTCAGCGRRYQAEEAIHRRRGGDGWIAIGCCIDRCAP